MSTVDARNKVAGLFVDLIAATIGQSRAVHAETAIASAARLAGSFLFRSFDFNIEEVDPGSIFLSENANEEGPELVSIMSSMLQRFGVVLDTVKLSADASLRGEVPKFSAMESLALLQDDAMRIACENGLSPKQAAQSAAMATAFIVKECSKDIGAEVGFNVAAFGLIEGSKTVPPPLDFRPQ